MTHKIKFDGVEYNILVKKIEDVKVGDKVIYYSYKEINESELGTVTSIGKTDTSGTVLIVKWNDKYAISSETHLTFGNCIFAVEKCHSPVEDQIKSLENSISELLEQVKQKEREIKELEAEKVLSKEFQLTFTGEQIQVLEYIMGNIAGDHYKSPRKIAQVVYDLFHDILRDNKIPRLKFEAEITPQTIYFKDTK